MSKLWVALLAAGVLVSAPACGAPKLTSAETCDRVKFVYSSHTGGMSKTGMIRFANAIRPIEAVSSDELKPALQAILDYADQSVKDNPDPAKIAGLQAEYENAEKTLSRVCG